MRLPLLASASFVALIAAQSTSAAQIIYSSQGAVNTFNATQSGVGNQIGEEIEDSGSYVYPWDYNAAQQVGLNNSTNISQNGANNLANFKQGQDNVHVFDDGFEYSFGSVTEAVFNALSLNQIGEDNTRVSFQQGNFNSAALTQSGNLNLVTTEQWGDMDIAEASQFGVENITYIKQSDFNGFGGNKSASVFQNGNSNYASIHQYEDYYSTISLGPQTANVDQIGSSNSTSVFQTGLAELDASILGDNNTHTVNQRIIAPFSPVNDAEIASYGDFNNISVTQAGMGGNEAEVLQEGDNNGVTLNQNRQDGYAMITQTGDNNTLNLTQNGVGNSFQISMVGSSHSISLTQY